MKLKGYVVYHSPSVLSLFNLFSIIESMRQNFFHLSSLGPPGHTKKPLGRSDSMKIKIT